MTAFLSNPLPLWPARLAAGLVFAVTLVPLGALVWRAGGIGAVTPADLAALRFTLWQALLSAVMSLICAIPLARALARRRFAGRGAVIALLGAPFILPVLVAVIGLLAIFGRGGLLNLALEALGLPRLSVYGLTGVVLAHVFLNLPLATRMLLAGWQAIPDDRFRLTASLGGSVWRLLERPMLARVLPGAGLVIFLVCLTSFTVTLTLGGGPKATTLELAIYQALRFDFAPDRAASLALMQLAVCAVAAGLAGLFTPAAGLGADSGRIVPRWDGAGILHKALDTLAILMAVAFLALPLGAVIWRGAPALSDLPQGTGAALLRSLGVAVSATALCMGLTLALASRHSRFGQFAGIMPMAISSLAMGAGLILLALPLGNPARFALAATVLVNALGGLPFALRLVGPEFARITRDYGRLADSLGLRGMARMRLLLVPLARRQVGFAAGLAAALAVGDLGVIALFGAQGQETLPLFMSGLMGAYRMGDAAAVALILAATAFGLFLICDLWGRRDLTH